MSYGYDRFLFLFINEVPVCYLSFRKDSLFLQETNRTANENSPYSLSLIQQTGIWARPFMNTTAGKSISIF